MKKTLKIIGNVVLWLFVAFAALLTIMVFTAQANSDGVPNLFGKIPVSILTQSMEPTIMSGDLVIDQSVTTDEQNSFKVDDIITFYADLDENGTDELNTHRIVEVNENDGYVFYTTKGDNNSINDKTEVRCDMVVGKYTGTKVGGVGAVLTFLQTPTGFLCVIVIPLVIFFLFELYRFIVIIVKAKNKGQVSKEDEEEIKKKAVEEYLKQQQEDKEKANK